VGVDPKLALTILDLESNGGARLNSGKGARGPMQLMQGTAAQYGVKDICDPQQNVHGAMLFLKDLTAQFQGNMMLIAAAYNAGPDRVYDARGVPPITETVRYVASAANRYYDLNVFAYRKKRASAHPRLPDPPPEVAANDVPDRSGQQRWIGGSVLYVGNNGNGEAQ
jgi:soluble lytic murein transglycosylase-like protein